MLPGKKITLRNRLGFIGLGHLGSRIARRLVDCRVFHGRLRSRSHESRGAGGPRRRSCTASRKTGWRGGCGVVVPSRRTRGTRCLPGNRQRSGQRQTRYPDYRAEHDLSGGLPAVTPRGAGSLMFRHSMWRSPAARPPPKLGPSHYSAVATAKSLKRPSRFLPLSRSSGFTWAQVAPVWP